MKRFIAFGNYIAGWNRSGSDTGDEDGPIYLYLMTRFDEPEEDIIQISLPRVKFTKPHIWWKGKKLYPGARSQNG
jgi:hypothetical protein